MNRVPKQGIKYCVEKTEVFIYFMCTINWYRSE